MNLIKSVYYFILNLITFGKGIKRTINNTDVVFPARYYKYYESDYESEGFRFVQSMVKPGNVVLDIGGHIGLYAVAFGKLVQASGKVYSFEPTPSTNSVLRQTIKLNALQNIVSVRNEAISKEKGETTFYISGNLTDNSNSLVNFRKSSGKGIHVPLISVDDFSKELQKKIDFIKIDVEGAELDAVAGAKETMLRDRPLCILALHPYQIKTKGDNLEAIWDLVVSYQYEVFLNDKKIEKSFFSAQQDMFDVCLIPM